MERRVTKRERASEPEGVKKPVRTMKTRSMTRAKKWGVMPQDVQTVVLEVYVSVVLAEFWLNLLLRTSKHCRKVLIALISRKDRMKRAEAWFRRFQEIEERPFRHIQVASEAGENIPQLMFWTLLSSGHRRILTVTLDAKFETITINLRERALVTDPDGVLQLGDIRVHYMWVFGCVINSEPKLLRVVPRAPSDDAVDDGVDNDNDDFGKSVEFWYKFVKSVFFTVMLKWNTIRRR